MSVLYIKDKNYIRRGTRSYGIPLDDIRSFFIRGIRSWSVNMLWEKLEVILEDKFNSVISVKYFQTFNDHFFLVKVHGSSKDCIKILHMLKKKLSVTSISFSARSRRNHKYTFSTLKRKILVSNKHQHSIQQSFQQSVQQSVQQSHQQSDLQRDLQQDLQQVSHHENIPDLQQTQFQSQHSTINSNSSINSDNSSIVDSSSVSQPSSNSSTYSSDASSINNDDFNNNNNSNDSSSSNKPDNFSFCLSWNTNGWNHEKRDSISYFTAIFKPLFLCFQETGNGSGSNTDYPCRVTLRNYRHFFKKADESVPGMRGLYLGFHNSCQASLENFSGKYIISIYTFSLWNRFKCSIGNVYMPHSHHNIYVDHAKLEVRLWLQTHSSHPSILVGDFNMSKVKLSNWLSTNGLGDWEILPLRGSTISWTRGDQSSDIDHALINSKMKDLIHSGSFINNFYPVSDHKPLLINGKIIPMEDFSNDFNVPKKILKWNRLKCIEEKESILSHNKFQILSAKFNDPNVSTDELSKEFTSTAFSIADELSITSANNVIKSSFHISQQIFNLQKIKMKLYKRFKKERIYDIDEFIKRIKIYRKLIDYIHKRCNEFRKQEYLHWIKTGCEYMKSHNPKKAWKWIKKTAKIGKDSFFIAQPIKNKNGELVVATEEQLEVWHDHFENLASDPSGVSLDLEHWYEEPMNKRFSLPMLDEWDINQDISIDEVKSAILSTPNYKASGPDGIPIEFYKALIPSSNDSNNATDNNSSGNTTSDNDAHGLNFILKLFNRIWDGDFPNSWNESSIVSIPKKGDLTDCDNYRGISLINNGIKLISKIVTTRISEYGLKNNFIRPEQFGFRKKEESISLFISIQEICRRRQLDNKETYLAFLDLRKAYDSVPIGNILHKLDCLGIRGKSLQFIKNLYLTSKANVKLDGQFSKSFDVKKGVRQGCPLSPILFNLFINDIFKECEDLGVSLGDTRCCGGLFADDIVICAPTRGCLKKMLRRVNEWALYNEMEFGIQKCSTMVIRPESIENQNKKDPTFYLTGQPIPTTDCYTYLGVPFDKNLSLKPVIKALNNKVLKGLFSVSKFLRNPNIPIPFKKLVLNSQVISRVSYFAPLLGSNKARSRIAQKHVNKGIRWVAGVHKAVSFISLYSISKDLNIPPLSAKCALAQVRCFNKWKNSNCIISHLVNYIPKFRKYTWCKSSRTLDKKLKKHGDVKAVKNFYWKDLKGNSIKAQYYDDNKFIETKDFIKLCYEYPEFAYGFYWLLKARSGYKLDARVAKAAKFVDPVCPNYCPCCKCGDQSIKHWLLDCPTFRDIRIKHYDSIVQLLNFFSQRNSNSPINNNEIDNISRDSNNINSNSNNSSNNNSNSNNSNSNNSNNNNNRNNNISNDSNSEDNNSNLDSNLVNDSNSSNNPVNINVYDYSSVCSKIFKFLLGGRSFNNINYNSREWKELCKRQIQSGTNEGTPFLTVTAELLTKIMPFAIGQQWSMFKRFEATSKSVNAEETVRQARRASATNGDHNFVP